jgi:hypothetical protein
MAEHTQIPTLICDDITALYALLGVGDLIGVEGTEERIVKLSERSDVSCPLHHFELFPMLAARVGFSRGKLPRHQRAWGRR